MPAMLGVMLMVMGVLLIIFPKLVAYILGVGLIFVGAGVVAVAWRLRSNVTYRRIHVSSDVEA